ncbi:MAG: nucleotide exchange factor GrpE [Acidimicrobiales bacterium]|nr:nucleotide exchange factor GrpE [Acidimicrobiales bacterium]
MSGPVTEGAPSPAEEPEGVDPSTDVSGPLPSVSGTKVTPDPDVSESDSGNGDPLPGDDEAEVGDPVLDVMAVLEDERDGYLVDLQRVTAEFANFRKQVEKRSAAVSARARGDLVEKILPVLDACDLAVEHGADDVIPIRTSLVQVLEPAGLEVLDPLGEPFDPTRHEAVLHEPADDPEDVDVGQVVVGVLRRGYVWDGRVLRPAMVRVRG